VALEELFEWIDEHRYKSQTLSCFTWACPLWQRHISTERLKSAPEATVTWWVHYTGLHANLTRGPRRQAPRRLSRKYALVLWFQTFSSIHLRLQPNQALVGSAYVRPHWSTAPARRARALIHEPVGREPRITLRTPNPQVNKRNINLATALGKLEDHNWAAPALIKSGGRPRQVRLSAVSDEAPRTPAVNRVEAVRAGEAPQLRWQHWFPNDK
jgi:hypothetical protein